MSVQPFGFNIHLRYLKDIGKLHERMRALKPSVCVVMVDDNPPPKEDQTVYIQEFAARYPQTLIVARVKHDHDAGYHLPPPNDPEKRPYVASPTDFLNKWGHLGKNNMTLYALNEPLASEKTDDADIQKLIKWGSEVIEQAVSRGVSVTIYNFGMGQPALNATTTEWDKRFDPLLVQLSKHRDTIFLGLHEYGPEERYHWGRLEFMLARCAALKIPPPRIIISEFGVDATTDKRNGYKARGWSGDFYMHKMVDIYSRLYMSLVDQGIVKGTCLFSYGNSGGWGSFDVEDDKPFFDTLTDAITSGSMKSAKPLPPPEPPAPALPFVPIPAHIGNGEQFKIVTPIPLQAQPSIDPNCFVGRLIENEPVIVHRATHTTADNKTWFWIQRNSTPVGESQYGWGAPALPAPPPDPVIPPPPQSNAEGDLRLVAAKESMIQTLEQEIAVLRGEIREILSHWYTSMAA